MKKITTPAEIMQIANAFRESRVLLTGYELGIFSALGNSEKTSAKIAEKISTDARATDRLMNALTSIGFLRKKDDKFSNTEPSKKFLVEGSPAFMSGIGHTVNIWNTWTTMTESVTKGKGVSLIGDINARGNEWLKSFIAAMHMRGGHAAKEAAGLIELKDVNSMLDVGGGSGAFTFEFLRNKNELKAAIFDLPNVVPLTQQYIKSEGFEGRVNVIEGDYHKDELGTGYDMIFLSAIIHSNSPEDNKKLFSKCHKSLNQKGKIVVLDYVMNDSRTEPYIGAMFALNMLVGTENGDTYTENEIKNWFKETGFKFESKNDTDSGTSIITGRKQ
jgi:ubiquinone/menaquinone biosynthesis C-methylase UbiE